MIMALFIKGISGQGLSAINLTRCIIKPKAEVSIFREPGLRAE